MDHPAVDLWRRKFKLNLSASWKRDVEITVKDLETWKEILDNWFYFDSEGKKHAKHPGIKGLLDEYEYQTRKHERDVQAFALSARSGERVSEGSGGYVPKVSSQAPRCYFGTD